ncbi:Copper-transporting P-type ATPase [Anaerococcus prevotii]|uniref:Cd(2+)-exporting ATPase n=1 Tax=Anaerococcus prevotii (strain ATCC 9321 / DSM 20548 / JCM 6508 / NCTC 11806 / PC1) TaxID=525919 RepID=C7RF28_ANAPD|nr:MULTISPECIES: heavy metal translocating P-type ATPase [Anaerococcus]ACV28089.1 heavy metal translocating P-type ATPase [Anaerococcus prevotii DSM 20548]SUU93638.1 Copper-transporting P-type ATPase [Anaerococcus prevotii]
MRASIAHRIEGRSRFTYEDYIKEENLNKLKYRIEEIEGVKSCRVSILTKSITVNYEERFIPQIARAILDLDLKTIEETSIERVDFEAQSENDIFHILRDAMYTRIFFKYILPQPLGTIGLFFRAYPFIKAGVKSLIKRKVNVEVLDATAISISLATRKFGDAANIMFLLGLGEKLEDYTMKKSQEDLANSLALNVDNVFVIENGEKIIKNIKEVEEGDLIEVEMGNLIPVDGKVIKGVAMVNESSFTGESNPVKKSEGSIVFAGTALEEGAIIVETKKKYDESRLSHIIELISDSEKNKSLAQKNAENMADSLVKYSFVGAGLTYLLTRNLEKAKSFLMVDFSCALKLTIPIAIMKAISQASEKKVLVKGGKYLENLSKANTIVFDKTGTLTKSEPRVAKVIALDDIEENECLRIAACLEEHFPHSIASAVVEAARARDLKHEEMHSKPEYIVAHGIKTTIVDKVAMIGSEHFILDDEGVEIDDKTRDIIDRLKEDYSLLYLAFADRLIAVICIEDPLREEATDIVKDLRDLSIDNIAMLTGDAENAARSVAEKLGLDYYKSQVLPEDKQKYVMEEKDKGRTVVMIGDGINDSVALSSSDVGISMHQGADIAKEISDISIGSDSLEGLVDVVKLSKAMDKRIKTDYKQIVSINSSLIILGVLGILSNTSSSLLHNLSTVMIAGKNMKDYKI